MANTPSVWIIDDDPDDQFLLARAFEEMTPSVQLRQLEDGDELVPGLQEALVLPRLILLDLNMPRQNGFETLNQLRSIPAYVHLPVVVLTTSSHEADKRKSLELGATGYLTKPPSLAAVMQMLQKLTSDWLND